MTRRGWWPSYDRLDNPDNIDDDDFVLEIIYRLEQQYKIDPDRIYATGFSAGGFMSYQLGAKFPDVFAAIAPDAASMGHADNASAPMRVISEPKGRVSVIVFHGTKDGGIDYYGGPALRTGLITLSVAKSVAIWVNADQCSKTPQNTTTSNRITSVYADGKKGIEVVLNTYVNGIHEWPQIATDLAWDFFMSHPKQH